MNKPSNETLLKARLDLEKDKELFPEFRVLIDNQIKNVEKIMAEKGIILVFGLLVLGIGYIAYNPPMEMVSNILTPFFE